MTLQLADRYAGTVGLARLALRRDRILVGSWLVAVTLVVYASAAATASLYPSTADRVAAAQAINHNAAIVALYGPINDVESLGELAMTKLTVLYAAILAVLFVVLVRRHTRGEEESGRAELVAGTAVGRDAILASALLVGGAVSALAGGLAALADLAGGLPVMGSIGFGASWAGVSLVSVGLTAVACQLSASARTCGGIAATMIATLYVLRAVGDIGPSLLSWASPFGWSTRLSPWSDPRWWVLGLYAALAASTMVTAQVLRARRDLGAGLFPARPGPAHGSPRMSDTYGLAWRLLRPALLGWTLATAALGAVLGAIAPAVGDLLDSDTGRHLLETLGGVGALEDALLSAVLSLAAVLDTCFGITVLARSSADEHDGRTEQVLATTATRGDAIAASLLVAVVGSAWLLAVTGLATGLGLGRDVPALVGAALAGAPAVWVVLGLTALLYSYRSTWVVLGWVSLAACFLVGQLGDLLRLPTWVRELSPYAHIPAMPVERFDPLSAATMTIVAGVLLSAAWWQFRRRDIG